MLRWDRAVPYITMLFTLLLSALGLCLGVATMFVLSDIQPPSVRVCLLFSSPLFLVHFLLPSLCSCMLTQPPDSRQTTHQIPDNNMLPCCAPSLGHRIRHDCRCCPSLCCMARRQYRCKSIWNNGDHDYGALSIDCRFVCINLSFPTYRSSPFLMGNLLSPNSIF